MKKARFTVRVAVYLILIKEENVLLMRRFNTGWADGMYTFPAGHFEGKETIADEMVREAEEEIGITIDAKDLRVVHVMHELLHPEYIDFYLQAKKWQGKPENREENKCDDLRWFPLSALPKNILPTTRQVLNHYKKHQFFSEFTWSTLPSQ